MGKLTKKDNKEIEQEVMCETRKQMIKAGLGLDRGLKKLDQLLECTKPISCIKGKDADSGTVDFIDVPDNPSQAKALDILLTLGDYYPNQKNKQGIDLSNLKIVIHQDGNPKKK